MNLIKVRLMKEEYAKKARENNYDEELCYIAVLLGDILANYPNIGTEADEFTFGEFTRRVDWAKKELEKRGVSESLMRD